jgi:hypothetical protein
MTASARSAPGRRKGRRKQGPAIPEIATLILGRADGVPPVWPGHRFDLVWVFDLQADGIWSFAQAPQLLLPGDSAQPIGGGGQAATCCRVAIIPIRGR